MSLFRLEVLNQRFRAPFAQPLQLPSRQLRGLSLGLFITTLLGFAAVLHSSYASKVRVMGYTEPASGVTKVYPTDVGVVTAVHVVEGEWVASGTSLMTITLQRYLSADQAMGDLQEAQLERQLAELAERQTLRRQQQRDAVDLLQQREQQQLELLPLIEVERSSHAQRQLLLAERVAAMQQLTQQGVVPKLQLSQAQADLLALELAGAGLARQHLEVGQRLADVRANADARRTQLHLQASEQRSEGMRLKQQLLDVQAARRTQVLAPVAGSVSFLRAQIGKRVAPNQALLNLVDTKARQGVVLLLPSRAAAQVQPGQRVSLRYLGRSPQESELLWGEVVQVSSTPVAVADLDVPVPLTEPVYRAKLQIQETSAVPQRLVPGLLVEADIRLQQARLWRWLVQPLRSAWQRL